MAVVASVDSVDRQVCFRPSCFLLRVAGVRDRVAADSENERPIEGLVVHRPKRPADKLVDGRPAEAARPLGLGGHWLVDP